LVAMRKDMLHQVEVLVHGNKYAMRTVRGDFNQRRV
jgi:hypothetical protein